jgi:hypothetical protein
MNDMLPPLMRVSKIRLIQINSFGRSGSHDGDAFYQGTTLQAAEKLILLKGTGFSPYESHQKQERL